MKSQATYRTITEVSDILDVPAHVLRFWETQFVQVKPVKRVGGRRYYRVEDVDLLTQIRDCLYRDGYTIKGVQKLLKGGKGVEVETATPSQDMSAVIDELTEIKEYLGQYL